MGPCAKVMGRAGYAQVTETALWSAKAERMNALYTDIASGVSAIERQRDNRHTRSDGQP